MKMPVQTAQGFRPQPASALQLTCTSSSQAVQIQPAPAAGHGARRTALVTNKHATDRARIEFGPSGVTADQATGLLIMPSSVQAIPIEDATHMAYIADGGAGAATLDISVGVGS